ncbi:MAG: hypothetical protein F4Y82_03440 [Cenarchaeum sp. SB0665_bin_23]|nr:hypothetical protein [Cenarchaeum sp. SB0664_bin_35]MXY61154.1 hypothetical protein [Cenarchaeum sp. SB0665_bin_23]MYG33463.1 hypothetical protein [Cenarchaeum sp. SB0677_bin_16]
MVRVVVVLCVLAYIGTLGAAAEVYVPDDEYTSYVDANGIYTIVGNVKNQSPTGISTAVTVSVTDGYATYTGMIQHNFIPANSELPFKVKIPQVPSPYDGDVILLDPQLEYNVTAGHIPQISVIYDEMLVLHANGTLSGFIVNNGNYTINDVIIWAVVHGADGVLDVSRSLHGIGPLNPGQTTKFVMHPDPVVADDVIYYSCFAPSSRSTYPVKAERDGMIYNLRYESGAWIYRPEFTENGTALTLQTTNSYTFDTFANIEIPPVTRQETFQVYRNDMPIDFVQSVDELGMWHLAFDIRKLSQDVITIKGFVPGVTMDPLVPEYLRYDAEQWILDESQDRILDDLFLLSDVGMISAGYKGEPHMPRWLVPLAQWYVDGIISGDKFLDAISYMIDAGIIVVIPD